MIGASFVDNKKTILTYADMDNSVVLGAGAVAARDAFGLTSNLGPNEGQGVAVGSSLYATAQATALGNNTYSVGRSSIAIGNDDTHAYTNKITDYDFNHYFKKLYAQIDPSGSTYGYAATGGGPEDNRKWSPTLAQGHGSIAIGSRSIAYANGTTALGTLAFALKQGSTAVGNETRAEGAGAIAFGRRSNVFADNAIAIGSHVYSNVEYDYDKKIVVRNVPKGRRETVTSLFGNINNYTSTDKFEGNRGLYGFDLHGLLELC